MKCRGLIFRELYLSRKHLIPLIGVWFLFSALGILIQLSMLYGNLAQMAYNKDFVFYVFAFIPAAISMGAVMQNSMIILTDYSTKWNLFRAATPVSPTKNVGVKYGIAICGLAAAFGVSAANMAILCQFDGRPFDRQLLTGLLCLMLIFSFCFVSSNQLSYRCRTNARVQAVSVPLALAFSAVFIASFGYGFVRFKKSHAGENDQVLMDQYMMLCKDRVLHILEMLSTYFWIIPLAVVAILAIGYVLDVKAMQRREN